jgi:hypothetical protein
MEFLSTFFQEFLGCIVELSIRFTEEMSAVYDRK